MIATADRLRQAADLEALIAGTSPNRDPQDAPAAPDTTPPPDLSILDSLPPGDESLKVRAAMGAIPKSALLDNRHPADRVIGRALRHTDSGIPEAIGAALCLERDQCTGGRPLAEFRDAKPDYSAGQPQGLASVYALAKAHGWSSAHCADSASKSRDPAAPWADLVPLGTPNLPRLPADILPAWAGAYAAALAMSTETPPELAIGMILAAAAMAGDIANAESQTKTLQARAAKARADAAKAKNPNEIEEATREAAKLEASILPLPVAPQLWTSDATPERLGPMLADQGECMAWLSSEAGLFDLLAGRYSKGIPNLDLVLKAWSGDAERVDRGSRPPVFLRSPRLTIGLSPQPDVLRGLSTNPGFRGRGLLGRFFYLLPPSPLGYRDLGSDRPGARVPESVEIAYRDGLRAMLDWPPALDPDGSEVPHLIHLEPAAYTEWLDFARMVEARMRPGGDLEGLTDLAGKVPGGAARIAGVLHGIEHARAKPWEAPVSLVTMGRALTLAAVMLAHSAAVLDMMGADPTIAAARKVWEWLERGRRDKATVREVFNALSGTFPRVSALDEALEALDERGYVRVVEPVKTGPGRPPSPSIKVRPEFVEAWS